MNRREFIQAASAVTMSGGFAFRASNALAQSKQETLLIVSENGPNNLDVQGVGTNRAGYEVAWNCYDRLVSYGSKTLADGSRSYDRLAITPELAERWEVDAKGITFHLRRDATFHDGSPVRASDVKWSFDRAVSVGGFPTAQMAAGSLLKPDQFSALDELTFRVEFARPDALTLPDIAVVVPVIFNAALVRKNATAADPWGLEFTKNNVAGGGAFEVQKWTPGTEVAYLRNDDWKCGPLPSLKRVLWRVVPSAGNRRALIERGDADLSFDLPAKDFAELKAKGQVTVASTPVSNGMWSVELNVTKPPFDNVKVRQAIAYALPYKKIMDAVLFNEARPLFGAGSNVPDSIAWPCATAYDTDIAKAKALIAEAGLGGGFPTVISFDLGQSTLSEPIAVLIQESLAAIGVTSTIDKVPGANWRGEMAKKSMAFMVNFFSGWLDYPEYFFFFAYHGRNEIFNTMSYRNAELDRHIDAARAAAASGDQASYQKEVRDMIALAYDEVPRIPLFQPFLNVATQKSVTGYEFWFHRQLDYRSLIKSEG
jgi:peptide/nickel transport system substrate-binding protein